MRRLFENGTKWVWKENRDTDFNKIKQELATLPCLSHYNGNKENIVTTDACKSSLGVALWQKRGKGKLKPIVFAGRSLNDAQKSSISELELLDIVWVWKDFDSTYTANKFESSWTLKRTNHF